MSSSRFEIFEDTFFLIFDICLIGSTSIFLISSFFLHASWADPLLAIFSFLGLLPVVYSAAKSLWAKQISVDLLASIALAFSLLARQWSSAAFITLMLAFARIFDHVTQARAKRIIQSLMRYHVENVRVKKGESITEVHISKVKPGDLVIIEAGDRIPVDGVVVSGTAALDESSLTGESDLVSKKVGDQVRTSTINQSGSLMVKAERIGADTTLAHIIALVEEASRSKSRSERMADTFTQWYIGLCLVGSGIMYAAGLSLNEILAVLLVVCADDIAVAVPLAFTAAISRTARRGVIIKGSAAFEQLSRLKYVLTDKTGTLTRGKPKIIDIKSYDSWTLEQVIVRAGMGASESKHAVSRAILDYMALKNIKVHAPNESEEIPGQGVVFRHGGDRMLLGRLSFMEEEKVHISEQTKKDIEAEKNAGHGIVLLAMNSWLPRDVVKPIKERSGLSKISGVGGTVIGLLAYDDELRPRVKEIIAETKELGVKEWHMLTGDNERAAAAVSAELDIKHYHANMTPESKEQFVAHFERSHEPNVVGYIGDGVNDAASLALVDVSVAMGGIGSDAAIEAADIAIMKDRLYRLPEIMRTARQVRRIMWQCFAIWAVTNVIGLVWVSAGIPGLGILGPAGAAAYNFLTDFIPIGNALRAGRISRNFTRV